MITINAFLVCGAILYIGIVAHKRKPRLKSSWLLDGESQESGDKATVEMGFKDEVSFLNRASFTNEVTQRAYNRVDPYFYQVVIVRAWNEQSEQSKGKTQRFVLEIPATGERYGFTSADAMQKALNSILTGMA